MIRFGFVLIFVLNSIYSYATHNRSGEITYKHISGFTYEFTITTCTKSSAEADRNELEVKWGDGTSNIIPRVDIEFFSQWNTQKNTYIFRHTYAGPSVYTISMEDPNRNFGVLNISNSVNQPFCIQTQLVISPFIGTPNNSLKLDDCPCPELACANQIWCYNTGAFDTDGDSLAYELIPCKGQNCLSMTIPGVYQYPQDLAGGVLTIDPVSGTLCWDKPQFQGEYNIAIKISEYRKGIYIGSVVRDMQITVQACSNNAPEIKEIKDTCIEAGTNLSQTFFATDVDNDLINFTATGELFNLNSNVASYQANNGNGSSSLEFNWTPNCENARNTPYNVILTAEDNNLPIPLKDIFVWRISVKIPDVENLNISPLGNKMQLSWDQVNCGNQKIQYKIYRKIDTVLSNSKCCLTNEASNLGYTLIGETTNTNFIDSSNLSVGNNYCYVVTAFVLGVTESCPSNIACAILDFEVPVITRVSINSTGLDDSDTVSWSYPKELDTLNFPGPYQYKLYYKEGFFNASNLIFSSQTNTNLENIDTVFVHNNIDTKDTSHNYRIELFSNNILVGSSITSSSSFLKGTPTDNQSNLSWNQNVSWLIDSTEIYRKINSGSNIFLKIGSTTNFNYIDSGLTNGTLYCYKVLTYGKYSTSGIQKPLKNWSQEICVTPTDLTPPCAPNLSSSINCKKNELRLSWNNPNNSCADDVVSYTIYYANSSNDKTPKFLMKINLATETNVILSNDSIVPACYLITATDSAQYGNESVFSNVVCIDNCPPIYELPNVFTPNGGDDNEVYHPILPFRFVDKVKFRVRNRWGNDVFYTEDPMLNWDGTHYKNKKKLNEGTYFYICEVFVNTLSGEKSFMLHGFITLLR